MTPQKKIRLPNGKWVMARRIKSGSTKRGDIVISPDGYYEPQIVGGNDGFPIDSAARRAGQGDIYRPLKSPAKPKAKLGKVKAVRAIKPVVRNHNSPDIIRIEKTLATLIGWLLNDLGESAVGELIDMLHGTSLQQKSRKG